MKLFNDSSKFMLLIAVVTTVLFVAGCYQKSGEVQYQNGHVGAAYETCYKGVTYVKFDDNENSWGSVMYTPEGKIKTCQ